MRMQFLINYIILVRKNHNINKFKNKFLNRIKFKQINMIFLIKKMRTMNIIAMIKEIIKKNKILKSILNYLKI